METPTASCTPKQLAVGLLKNQFGTTVGVDLYTQQQISLDNRLLLEPTSGFKEENDMSKKKGTHDHDHDGDGHDHKEHDHAGCGGHEHGAHDHHEHGEGCDHDHEERIITLQGEDGKSYDCHVAGVFPFEGKEYVLLQTIADEGEESEDEVETIIMEMIEENDMATFRSIESDEEFERVMDFVMKVAKEADEAYARGDG